MAASLLSLLLSSAAASSHLAAAQPGQASPLGQPGGATREAARHFQRGVSLYGETDYRGALAEFKRAYAIAPNAAVLYNVGETQFQLQDYAAALATLTSFLAEAGPNDGHRAEVEGTIDVLRSRIGRLVILTEPQGADVTIDDQPVGKTPFAERVIVSVGHRKITATLSGRLVATRFVDVAADDNVAVALSLPPAFSDVPPELSTLPDAPPEKPRPVLGGGALRLAGWITTGALGAGAATFGVLALVESSRLRATRDTFPTTGETLNHESKLTSTYSIAADALTGAALVVGGVTLLSTVSAATRRRTETTSRVWLGPGSAAFETTF